MKCDELKPLLYSIRDLAYVDEPQPEPHFQNPHEHAVYKATEVDAAIAELKRKLQDQCISCPVKMQEDDVVAELKAKLAEQKENIMNKKKINAFDCICVTDVRIFPFKEGPSLGRMKALAEIVLNDQFIVRGLRIMEGENGIYIVYPTYPFVKGDDYKSICNPITRQLREHIENTVLEKYQDTVNNEKVTNK